MLNLIGIGLKPKQITLEALDVLKECDRVYLESYTSQYSSGKKEDLEDLIGKAVTELGRKEVEEEFGKILEEAKTKNIALCIYGNPLNATTHVQVLLDAQKHQVKTKIIPGISVFEFAAFTGLERYKFGKTTSIVFYEDEYEPESFYDAILENQQLGLHTLCLLDIKKDEGKLMTVNHAISLLERIEEKREEDALMDSIVIGISGAGSEAQQIKAGTTEQVKHFRFTEFPQTLIVCGKLNEKEIEGLKLLSGLE